MKNRRTKVKGKIIGVTMRTKEDTLKRLTGINAKITGIGGDGMSGIARMLNDKEKGDTFRFVFSWGMGWEHLSVSLPDRCPTWGEMCTFKEIFWLDSEWCVQFHPSKSEYVNNHDYCLHIWKPKKKYLPTPPSILVGVKQRKNDETQTQDCT